MTSHQPCPPAPFEQANAPSESSPGQEGLVRAASSPPPAATDLQLHPARLDIDGCNFSPVPNHLATPATPRLTVDFSPRESGDDKEGINAPYQPAFKPLDANAKEYGVLFDVQLALLSGHMAYDGRFIYTLSKEALQLAQGMDAPIPHESCYSTLITNATDGDLWRLVGTTGLVLPPPPGMSSSCKILPVLIFGQMSADPRLHHPPGLLQPGIPIARSQETPQGVSTAGEIGLDNLRASPTPHHFASLGCHTSHEMNLEKTSATFVTKISTTPPYSNTVHDIPLDRDTPSCNEAPHAPFTGFGKSPKGGRVSSFPLVSHLFDSFRKLTSTAATKSSKVDRSAAESVDSRHSSNEDAVDTGIDALFWQQTENDAKPFCTPKELEDDHRSWIVSLAATHFVAVHLDVAENIKTTESGPQRCQQLDLTILLHKIVDFFDEASRICDKSSILTPILSKRGRIGSFCPTSQLIPKPADTLTSTDVRALHSSTTQSASLSFAKSLTDNFDGIKQEVDTMLFHENGVLQEVDVLYNLFTDIKSSPIVCQVNVSGKETTATFSGAPFMSGANAKAVLHNANPGSDSSVFVDISILGQDNEMISDDEKYGSIVLEKKFQTSGDSADRIIHWQEEQEHFLDFDAATSPSTNQCDTGLGFLLHGLVRVKILAETPNANDGFHRDDLPVTNPMLVTNPRTLSSACTFIQDSTPEVTGTEILTKSAVVPLAGSQQLNLKDSSTTRFDVEVPSLSSGFNVGVSPALSSITTMHTDQISTAQPLQQDPENRCLPHSTLPPTMCRRASRESWLEGESSEQLDSPIFEHYVDAASEHQRSMDPGSSRNRPMSSTGYLLPPPTLFETEQDGLQMHEESECIEIIRMDDRDDGEDAISADEADSDTTHLTDSSSDTSLSSLSSSFRADDYIQEFANMQMAWLERRLREEESPNRNVPPLIQRMSTLSISDGSLSHPAPFPFDGTNDGPPRVPRAISAHRMRTPPDYVYRQPDWSQLPPGAKELVQSKWKRNQRPQVRLSKLPSVRVGDMQSLKPPVKKITKKQHEDDVNPEDKKAWLSRKTVDNYLQLMCKSRKNKAGYAEMKVIKTAQAKTLVVGSKANRFNKVKLQKEVWTTTSVIAFPILIGEHFRCIVAHIPTLSLHYMESTDDDGERFLVNIAMYLNHWRKKHKLEQLDFKKITRKDLPRQTNSFDCGIFIIGYVDAIHRGVKPTFTQLNTPEMRAQIAFELLQKSVSDGFHFGE